MRALTYSTFLAKSLVRFKKPATMNGKTFTMATITKKR